MSTVELDLLGYVLTDGDDIPFTFVYRRRDNGELYDFSGVTKAWYTIKENQDDVDGDALVGPYNSIDNTTLVKQGAPTPGDGKVWILFPKADTAGLSARGDLWYDVQILDGGLVHTLQKGKLKFTWQSTEENT